MSVFQQRSTVHDFVLELQMDVMSVMRLRCPSHLILLDLITAIL
jgi:hypothetical protein